MQKRENYLYVGMDLHKETHTAVLVNCWNEKLDVIVIENKPSEFNKLAKRVNKTAEKLGLTPVYGLENAHAYALVFLQSRKQYHYRGRHYADLI